MSDTFLRQWAMLKLIPRHPRKTDTAALQSGLAAINYCVDVRTIQRDLNTLSAVFPLIADEGRKPQGWSWAQDAEVMDIPGLDPRAALTFKLVESFLKPLLPAATLTYLDPHLKNANNVLRQLSNQGMKQWPDKVRILPRGQALLPPKINAGVQDAVYQALLEDKKLTVTYLPRGEVTNKEYEVNPLALVFRDSVVYLVCTFWTYSNPMQLVLHRIKSATVLNIASITPEGFNLDDYIRQGEFGFPAGGEIKLEAIFDKGAAHHLYETPLSRDQTIADVDEDRFRLKATVTNTSELKWWLLAFGDEVEVMKPKSLRGIIKNSLKAVAYIYNN